MWNLIITYPNCFRKHDSDVHMSAAFAPCRFAFNVPERRMTLLSGKLAGLILPYYDYGSHLDDFGHTIDIELKKLNLNTLVKHLLMHGEISPQIRSQLL